MRNPAGWNGNGAKKGVILLGKRGCSHPGRVSARWDQDQWEGVGEAQRLAERRRGEKGGSAAGRAFPWGHAAGQVSRSRLSRGREGAVGEWQVYRADNKGSDCRPGERNPVCSSDPEADFRAPRAFS